MFRLERAIVFFRHQAGDVFHESRVPSHLFFQTIFLGLSAAGFTNSEPVNDQADRQVLGFGGWRNTVRQSELFKLIQLISDQYPDLRTNCQS